MGWGRSGYARVVQNVADVITLSNVEDGVAVFLEKHILGKDRDGFYHNEGNVVVKVNDLRVKDIGSFPDRTPGGGAWPNSKGRWPGVIQGIGDDAAILQNSPV